MWKYCGVLVWSLTVRKALTVSQFIVLKKAKQVDVGLPSHSILAINVFQKMYLNMVQCHESASGSQE